MKAVCKHAGRASTGAGHAPGAGGVPAVLQARQREAVKVRNNDISNEVDLGVRGQRQRELELAVKG